MDIKKTPQADLQNKSFLFFNIGLVVTLSLTIAAFNYRVYDDTSAKELKSTAAVIEDIMEPPPTEHLPPPPAQINQPQIVEVPDDAKIEEEIKINMDIETHMDQQIAEVPIAPPVVEVEKEDPHQVFLVVEETAVPEGGMQTFYKYVSENLKYPAQARRMTVEGKVFVQFIVEKDGSITDVQTVKGIGAGCDEEAMRVLSSSPKWKPAKQRGKPVRQRMVLPVIFKLADN